jgi:hypothetical protein
LSVFSDVPLLPYSRLPTTIAELPQRSRKVPRIFEESSGVAPQPQSSPKVMVPRQNGAEILDGQRSFMQKGFQNTEVAQAHIETRDAPVPLRFQNAGRLPQHQPDVYAACIELPRLVSQLAYRLTLI